MGCAAQLPPKTWKSSDFIGKKTEKEREALYQRSYLDAEYLYCTTAQIEEEIKAQKAAIVGKSEFQIYTTTLFASKKKTKDRIKIIRKLLERELEKQYPDFTYYLRLIRDDWIVSLKRDNRHYYEHFLVFNVTRK